MKKIPLEITFSVFFNKGKKDKTIENVYKGYQDLEYQNDNISKCHFCENILDEEKDYYEYTDNYKVKVDLPFATANYLYYDICDECYKKYGHYNIKNHFKKEFDGQQEKIKNE